MSIIQTNLLKPTVPKECLMPTNINNFIPYSTITITEGPFNGKNFYVIRDSVVGNLETGKYCFLYYHPSGNQNILLDTTVQEFYDTPLKEFNFSYSYYQPNTTTNSETGVTTTTYQRSVSSYSSGYEHAVLGSCNSFIIKNPMMTMYADYPIGGTQVMGANLYSIMFDFSNGVQYSQTLVDHLAQGTGTKGSSKDYSIYLNHETLKNALISRADSYTTITAYHLDGTAW